MTALTLPRVLISLSLWAVLACCADTAKSESFSTEIGWTPDSVSNDANLESDITQPPTQEDTVTTDTARVSNDEGSQNDTTVPQPDSDNATAKVELVYPSDLIPLPAPEVTDDYVSPAWEWAFIKKYTNGFPLQPRVSITLSKSALDVDSLNNETVYIRKQGSTERRKITQIIWDDTTRTIHFVPVRYLQEDTTYEVVTTSALTVDGDPVEPSITPFTTGNFTSELDIIRTWLDQNGPTNLVIDATAKFGPIIWTAHRGTVPPGTVPLLPWSAYNAGSGFLTQETFAEAGAVPVPLVVSNKGMTGLVPLGGGNVRIFQRFTMAIPPFVDSVVFGHFDAPWFLTNERLFPNPVDKPVGNQTLYFTLYVPQGTPPSGGWPVMIFGNGYRSHRHNARTFASTAAQNGLAVFAISAVGHGGGPDGTMTIDGTTISDGGRAVDVDGDGYYNLEEGMASAWNGPNNAAVRGMTDGVRQTVVDQMSAIRMIAQGIVNISKAKNDRSYFGISNGGRYGAILMGVDPELPTAILNVAPTDALLPLANQWRSGYAMGFKAMVPPLDNEPHPILDFFTEDIPMRYGPVQIGLVDGANAIQEYLERARWASMPANAAIYAHRYASLEKKVLIQVARGDTAVANPSTADLIREGDLQATTCMVWPERSLWKSHLGNNWLGSIHIFAYMPFTSLTWHPGVIGRGARGQLVKWAVSNGNDLYDPDAKGNLFGKGDVFEVPLSDSSLDVLDREFGYDPVDL